MATVTSTANPSDWTVADMLAQLGGVSPNRIHMSPTPGKATEDDLLAFQARSGRICELIDGVLVEKIMGAPEALLAGFILHLFWEHLEIHDLGIVLAPDGLLRILGRQIRVPNVSFIRWERFADRQVPRERVFSVAPDLAIEILSPGNTPEEMSREASRVLHRGRSDRVVHRSGAADGLGVYRGRRLYPVGGQRRAIGRGRAAGVRVALGRLFAKLDHAAEEQGPAQ